MAEHVVRTPGAIWRLTLELDVSGRAIDREREDLIFCRVFLRDAHGTVVPDAWENVAFGTTGAATLIGANPFATDAGIAAILIRTDAGGRDASVHAFSPVRDGEVVRPLDAAISVIGRVPDHDLTHSLGEADPGRTSVPRPAESGLRVGMIVGGRRIASLALDAPKLRMAANAPPERREGFER